MKDEELVAECVRRGWRVCYPGDPKDAGLFDPPDPDVKTAAEQRVLDSVPALNAAITEAAELLNEVLYEKGYSTDPRVTAWLLDPIVQGVTQRGERDTPIEPIMAVTTPEEEP